MSSTDVRLIGGLGREADNGPLSQRFTYLSLPTYPSMLLFG